MLVLIVDACLCVLTVWLAYYLRLGEWVFLSGPPLWAAITSVALALPVFVAFGLYRAIFRYSGWPALMAVTRASFVYGLMFAALFTAIEVPGIPRTVGLMQPLLLLLAVGASRAMARFWLGGEYQNLLKHDTLPRVLVYGAGTSGRQLAGALAHSHEMRVAGFLDDDRLLQGNVLDGHRIYAPSDLPALKETLQISDVLLAIPSLNRHQRNEILELMRRSRVSVRTLPRMADLAQGRVSISALRELDLEDLLGREPVAPNHILLRKNIHHKVVLVTGAGGSIGSELCRQVAGLDPTALLLVEQSEFALYELHQELLSRAPPFKLVPLLASVQDSHRMHEILSTWSPHTVYHAAAYKHVPMVEHNPAEGLKNNVLGTFTTAMAALGNGVSDFVLISTDKAVRPTNVMGTSKRLAEMVLQALAAESSATRFSMVRFGNVLGSSGSVVPLFRQQIKEGGPITLTHEEVTRYFMTIPEAAQLVIQAGAMARGGDVFVLDMGEPVRIMDLARRMVELSGLRVRDSEDPEGDIKIQVTGLRPGEKLYEELLIGNQPEPTEHSRIMKAHEDFLGWSKLDSKLDALTVALNSNDVDLIRSLLQQLVPGYQPEGDIVDWVHLEQNAEEPDG
ncbi:polysaccharide biosynthesis protein [Ferrovum sp.]|uniref:polysaccharide biosynthesis protein n=1 Tax=Ferrovum sp. TaxID=2609467 RepID=UPI00387E320E